MPVIFSGLFSLIGNIFGGIFGLKDKQADIVKEAIGTLSTVQQSDADQQKAASAAIQVIMAQGSPIERLWRPLFMVMIMIILISYWFGYAPPHFNEPMSPMMDKLFEILQIGVIGYMPLRSIDKWINSIQIASLLKTFIEKKLL